MTIEQLQDKKFIQNLKKEKGVDTLHCISFDDGNFILIREPDWHRISVVMKALSKSEIEGQEAIVKTLYIQGTFTLKELLLEKNSAYFEVVAERGSELFETPEPDFIRFDGEFTCVGFSGSDTKYKLDTPTRQQKRKAEASNPRKKPFKDRFELLKLIYKGDSKELEELQLKQPLKLMALLLVLDELEEKKTSSFTVL